MENNAYSFSDIYLPENKQVVKFLQRISLVVILLTFFIAGLILLTTGRLWIGVIAVVLLTLTLLSETRINRYPIGDKSLKQQKLFFLATSLIGSAFAFLIGIFEILGGGGAGLENSNLWIGICLILLGLALGAIRTRNKQRFYVVHTLTFVVLTINLLMFLGGLYELLLSTNFSFVYIPIGFTVLFMSLCVGIFLLWPGRGFFGIFTTDTISTKFSLRLLFINLILTFSFGFIAIVGFKENILSTYEVLTIFTVLFMALAVILALVNLKLLYKYELERLLMKEELRVRNISVDLSKEDLASKIVELQGKNKEYVDKLTSQWRLMDIADNLP